MMDAVDYKNGQKNQWRRTVWRLLKIYARPGPVLYLPGSTDLDRAEAIRKGFRPADLIAIERDEKVVAHLRGLGVTVIPGGLNEVLESWPADVPVGALLADLQCGFGEGVLSLAELVATHPALDGTAVVCNLQRGRDRFGAQVVGLTNEEIRPRVEEFDLPALEAAEMKSRAAAFFAQCKIFSSPDRKSLEANERMDAFRKRNSTRPTSVLDRGAPVFASEEYLASEWRYIERLKDFLEDYDRQCALHKFVVFPKPYRSTPSSPLFDSAVFVSSGPPRGFSFPSRNRPLAPQIAAALALRTRRLRGELNGGRHKTT